MTTTTTRYETDRQGNFIVTPEQMDETLAAERRATVERIRERLYPDVDLLIRVGDLYAILDKEAAR